MTDDKQTFEACYLVFSDFFFDKLSFPSEYAQASFISFTITESPEPTTRATQPSTLLLLFQPLNTAPQAKERINRHHWLLYCRAGLKVKLPSTLASTQKTLICSLILWQ